MNTALVSFADKAHSVWAFWRKSFRQVKALTHTIRSVVPIDDTEERNQALCRDCNERKAGARPSAPKPHGWNNQTIRRLC